MLRSRKNITEINEIKKSIVREVLYDGAEFQMSQRDVCDKTGLSQGEVSELLNGKLTRFTIDRLLMVLLAFGHKPKIYVC